MKKLPQCYGIIPARYESSRFPGKPLAKILGKPMFWHVFQRAIQCRELKQVVLATDDKRILSAAEKLNIPALMTRNDHQSGTDRVLEAARILNLPENSVIINIQGDEPALEPAMLSQLVAPFIDDTVQVTTLAGKMENAASENPDGENPDKVKVVFAKNGRALYFSRAPIPYNAAKITIPVFIHIGLYAFRFNILKQFVALGPSPLEIAEKLEQLRLLENQIPINVIITNHKSIGVDRPKDLKQITELLESKNIKKGRQIIKGNHGGIAPTAVE